MNRIVLCVLLLGAGVVTGCGSDDPVDVEGLYTVNVTNRENGCNFDNWTVNDTSSGIMVTVNQDGGQATAFLEGVIGGLFDLVLGNRQFEGDVAGNHLDLTLFGTNNATMGNCSYTVNANMDATLDGDVLTGFIIYTTNTNASPDCGDIEGCESRQEFNGTRPPPPK